MFFENVRNFICVFRFVFEELRRRHAPQRLRIEKLTMTCGYGVEHAVNLRRVMAKTIRTYVRSGSNFNEV